ncbi:MAG: diadenosine tetraphosphate hydrolase [Candidatus Levybacteria bacterium RIFCSPLOWO2_01_FULL_39_10]|nr:MAG: diadenosine tetraphosphate hydrolase [Candidatus Levybacteria bacterium RIFCSPLOWO2_01_FULL_39_10]
MYNHAPKNYDCPLCKLAKGEDTGKTNPDDIFYREDLITAFIAGKWWMTNPGHVIIIPNKHFENLYDIDEKHLEVIHNFSKKVAVAFKKVYKSDGTSVRQHNEPAGNQDVWHYHLHVFPRYENDRLYQNHEKTKWPTKEERIPYSDKLKTYFKKL